jgi:hypothetical protein
MSTTSPDRSSPLSHKLLTVVFFSICALVACLGLANSSHDSREPSGYIAPSQLALASYVRKGPTKHNIAIIVDTTAILNHKNGQSWSSSLYDTLAGVRTLLGELSPCRANESTCHTRRNGNARDAVDVVSLFTFPNVETVENEYNCGKDAAQALPYTFPSPTATSLSPIAVTYLSRKQSGTLPEVPMTVQATYQITPYTNDYRTSDSDPALNMDSRLVRSLGGKRGCSGLQAPGGESTFYAGAIYAAQASLLAELAARPGSQNVIILITDGYANSSENQMQSSATDSGIYPSWVNECGQAVTAARDAARAGTRVYSVANWAQSTGCETDVSGAYKGYSPCQTMQAIASSPEYFFSNYPSGSDNPCTSVAHPDLDLTQIFTQIAKSIESYRSATKQRRKTRRVASARILRQTPEIGSVPQALLFPIAWSLIPRITSAYPDAQPSPGTQPSLAASPSLQPSSHSDAGHQCSQRQSSGSSCPLSHSAAAETASSP